ncbi:MAG: hypothetical protein RJA09_2264 [Pseudomonadota bacterium]|jgi:HD-GYP domain-containing protein (c-di-GMP phosphodiesterase class II)
MYKPLPLNTVELNTPVPVNIWDARGTLLLRKGESILSEQHRESLQQHSPMVRESDYQAWTYSYTTQLDRMVRGNQPLNRIAGLTRPSELTAVAGLDTTDPVLEWQDLQGSLGVLLHQGPGTSDFVDRLLRVEQKALRLLELGPDNTLFVLVQQLFDRRMGYSASHALTCAAVCHLGAPAAGLAPQEAASLFKAALTMNMGMARLHDDLSRQAQPPTPAQRQAIDDHPSRSVSLLRQVGVADPFWLQVVLRHHQPQAGPEPTAVAQRLLHLVDVFVARISPRSSRSGMLSQQVAKDIYMGADGQPNPLGALLVKTVGIYPPGSYVRLANGEVAVVVRRGRRANAPVVFSIVGKQGFPLGEPALRDTLDRVYEVKGAVSPDDVKVVINARKLLGRA